MDSYNLKHWNMGDNINTNHRTLDIMEICRQQGFCEKVQVFGKISNIKDFVQYAKNSMAYIDEK